MTNRYTLRIVWWLMGSLLMASAGPVWAQGQALTESDKREIKEQAKKRIGKELAEKINNLVVDFNTESDIKLLILNSYLPNSADQQLFVNDDVILEDDLDPAHTGPAANMDKPVRQYLNDLVTYYPKNPDPERPSFLVTNVRVGDPTPDSPTSALINVFYNSAFKGNDKKGHSYQTVSRVATLQATKIGRKWEVFIRQIIFERRGAGLAQTAITTPSVATVAAVTAPPPPPIDIREPTGLFRQEDYEFNATIRYNSKALDVVKSESPRLPLGQYRLRDNGTYELNGNRIVFDGKNTFTFTNRDRDLLGFSRVEPAKPKPDTTRAVATKPAPETPKLKPEAPKVIAKTPVIETPKPPETKIVADVPKPVVPEVKPLAETPAPQPITAPPAEKPAPVVVAKAPEPKLPKPVVQKPMAMSVSPDLKKSLTNEQRRIVAGMRLRGWLQVVGGLAALGGSYVVYSGIKKDYDTYETKFNALNTDYLIYRDLSQRPVPPAPEPMSITAFGAPAVYGVYGGGVIGIGLTVNGIRTLFRAGKASRKKQR